MSLTWAVAPNWNKSAASCTHTGPPGFRFPASVWVRWRTWPGWVQIGAPGAEQQPPPVPRWTWMSSKSTCRSTHWRSSTCTHRQLPPTQWASKRMGIPTRAPGSQVSGWWLCASMCQCLRACMCQCPTWPWSCYCVTTVNSWSGQHPYEWYCGTHTPREKYEDQGVPPAWPSQHPDQWVSVQQHLSLSYKGLLKQLLVVLFLSWNYISKNNYSIHWLVTGGTAFPATTQCPQLAWRCTI